MALHTTLNGKKFGVGDMIRVSQLISEGEKTRIQVFEGMVIGIRGRGHEKTFTVRRIGAQQVGIERIYPVDSPIIQDVEVVKKGVRGIRQSKLYYTRTKSRKEISKIYSRSNRRIEAKKNATLSKKEVHKKLVAKNTSTSKKTKNAPSKKK